MFKGRTDTGGFTPLFAVAVASAVLLSVVAGAGISLPGLAGSDDATEHQTIDGEMLSGAIDLADADTRLLGEGGNDTAGWVVASAGDVNGDGRADVLVGAPRNDSNGNDSGAAYVFYGPVESGDVSLSAADVRLTGASAGDLAGADVAAGDLDGDGRSDLVIGAPFNDSAGANAGAAYVVYGSSELSGTVSLADAHATLLGVAASDRAGRSVATVNGSDGVHDLVVSAPYNDSAGNDSGATYVLDGAELSSGSLASAVTFTGAAPGDLGGWDVSSAGDFDGDGVENIVVSARHADTGGDDAGAVYVVSGAHRFDGGSLANATVELRGGAAKDNAGYAVSDAGDVNDDGYDDVLVGAPLNDSAGSNAGAAYVVYGSASPVGNRSLADANQTLRGVSAGDRAGWSVASAGSIDTNCDSYADVLVGAPYNNSTGPDAGAAYLVYGGQADGNQSLLGANATLSGAGAGDLAGWSVSGIEDANGDSADDVLIGAPYNDTSGTDAGVAYLFGGPCPEEQHTTTKTPKSTPTETKTSTQTESPTPTAKPSPKPTPTPTPTKPSGPTPTPTPTPTNESGNGSDAVEFINCSAVRIHGDYEGILIGALYLEGPVDANEYIDHDAYPEVVPERAEGTTVIDLTRMGGAAKYVDSVQLARDNEVRPDSTSEEIDHTATNPYEYGYDSCIDESRDADGDGLTDQAERDIAGTDPNVSDTDGDGLRDGQELRGIGPALEPDQYNTRPTSPDYDGDGYLDGEEVDAGTDPVDHSDHPTGEPSTEPAVRFLNCTAIEVTGEFDGVLITAVGEDGNSRGHYYSDELRGRDRVQGTTVIDISSEDSEAYLAFVRLSRDGELYEDGVESGPEDIRAESPYYADSFKSCPDDGEDGTDGQDEQRRGDTTQTTTQTTTTTTTRTTTAQTTTTMTTTSSDASVEFLDCKSARVNAPEGYTVRYSGFTFVETGQGAAHPNWADPIREDEWSGGEDVLSTDRFYPDDSERADRAVLASVAVFDSDYQQVASASNPDAESASDLCGQEAECVAANQSITGADPETCEGNSASRSASTPSETTTSQATTSEATEGASAASTTATTETTAAETTGTTTDER